MFGKFFASAFTGSMMASGPEVFAVWGYVIANTIDSSVELNPRLLAALIGSTPDRMQEAIDTLCLPDQHSRSKNDDGRRLIREGAFQYRVTNHAKYRNIRDEEGRREYNRIKQQEHRAKKAVVKQPVIDSQSQSSKSANTEAEEETEKEISPTAHLAASGKAKVSTFPVGFERFWMAYPRKVGKDAAAKAFAKRKPDAKLLASMLEAIAAQCTSPAWIKDGGQFIPHPATWLTQGRWQDEQQQVHIAEPEWQRGAI